LEERECAGGAGETLKDIAQAVANKKNLGRKKIFVSITEIFISCRVALHTCGKPMSAFVHTNKSSWRRGNAPGVRASSLKIHPRPLRIKKPWQKKIFVSITEIFISCKAEITIF